MLLKGSVMKGLYKKSELRRMGDIDILIKDIDKMHPASLSKKIIHKYLIEKFKYEGLIITDDLKMLAVRLRYSPTKAVELAINAGNDMVMIGLKYKTIEKIIKCISKKVEEGKISQRAINKSVDKIIKMKQKLLFEKAQM